MHVKSLIFILIFAFCAPASATGLRFLKDAPVTRLNAEELKAYRAFLMKTLSDGADGATAEWKAPKSAFTSKVTPAARFKDGATDCREAVIDSDSRDRQARGTYTFCRNAKGEWGIKNPSKGAKRAG